MAGVVECTFMCVHGSIEKQGESPGVHLLWVSSSSSEDRTPPSRQRDPRFQPHLCVQYTD